MYEENEPRFEQKLRSKGFDAEPEPLFWFYISFVSKPPSGEIWKTGGGRFMGAAVVECRNRVYVGDAALSLKLLPDGAKIGTVINIPTDRVPAPEYRNKLLTRAQVEALWLGNE